MLKTVNNRLDLCSKQGSLLNVTKCVKYARFILNRILTLLHKDTGKKIIKITKECKQDLNWFRKFLVIYNGVSFFKLYSK